MTRTAAAQLAASRAAAVSEVIAAAMAMAAPVIRMGAPGQKKLPFSELAVVTRPIAVAKLACAAIIKALINGMLHIRVPCAFFAAREALSRFLAGIRSR